MRRVAVVAALSLLLGASVSTADVGIRQELPDSAVEDSSEHDHTKDKACRCCEECMAAMKSTTKGKEEGTPKTGGCRECCKDCGKVKHPIDKQAPPEIVK